VLPNRAWPNGERHFTSRGPGEGRGWGHLVLSFTASAVIPVCSHCGPYFIMSPKLRTQDAVADQKPPLNLKRRALGFYWYGIQCKNKAEVRVLPKLSPRDAARWQRCAGRSVTPSPLRSPIIARQPGARLRALAVCAFGQGRRPTLRKHARTRTSTHNRGRGRRWRPALRLSSLRGHSCAACCAAANVTAGRILLR
jgi:hypothetical protein